MRCTRASQLALDGDDPGLCRQPLPHKVTYRVSKIRRGGFIFLAWVGDHGPRHVHVYRDGKLVVKWDLDNWQPIEGSASARIQRILRELVTEGGL